MVGEYEASHVAFVKKSQCCCPAPFLTGSEWMDGDIPEFVSQSLTMACQLYSAFAEEDSEVAPEVNPPEIVRNWGI